jgi:WD40 repeat protein
VSSLLELLYWDFPVRAQIRNIDKLENKEWHTHHCKLGWYAKGILKSAGNEHKICSIDVRQDEKLIAVSSHGSEVKMFHFPCVDETASARITYGHAPLVTKLRFSSDGQRLLTLGGSDQSILQWRLGVNTLNPLVQLLVNKAALGKPLYQVSANKQMVTTMIERFGRTVDHEEPPTSYLEIDFVYGYGGGRSFSGLFPTA